MGTPVPFVSGCMKVLRTVYVMRTLEPLNPVVWQIDAKQFFSLRKIPKYNE